MNGSQISNLESQIPVTVLTFRRPQYLARTLDSFCDLNARILGRFIFVILQNGGPHLETERVINARRRLFRDAWTSPKNLVGGGGFSALMLRALNLCSPRYVLHLEDDWECRESLSPYLEELLEYLDSIPACGQVRLRSIESRVCAKNPFRGLRHIPYFQARPNIIQGPVHFTFNPAITRAAVLPSVIPCGSEKDACKRYERLKLDSAQLQARCFVHIGEERVYEVVDGKKRYVR